MAKKTKSAEATQNEAENRVTAQEVADFTRAFSGLIDEGKSLVAALSQLADAQSNARLQEIIRAVNVKVRAGHTLSAALSQFPDVFDAAYIDAVRLGEINGTLDQMLKGLSRGDEVLTLDQAVQFLGTSKPTLYRLLSQNTLKGLRVGRQWRFRKTDLQAYMERKPEPVAVGAAPELDAEYQFFTGRLREDETFTEAVATSDDDKINAIDNAILNLALRAGASDVHLGAMRPQGGEEVCAMLQFRIDGVLHETRRMPLRLLNPLAGRLKVMADMNAGQRDLPQEGRISLKWRDKDFEAYVSSCPTSLGESIVMRLLDLSAMLVRLEHLSFAPADLERLREWLHCPSGQIYFCGPTGSGRTTTLYAALLEVQSPQKKIMTIEDPIEWQLPGVLQVGVNNRAGLTVASALRTFARQDADILMASQIRDLEAAEMATQLGLAGHLLLSSMPVSPATAVVGRLSGMGVENFLIAASLTGLMAQYLVRRICPYCREENAIVDDNVTKRLRELSAQGGYTVPDDAVFARGRGCERCHNTGYRGRVPLYELVTWSEPLAEAFLRGADNNELMRIAIENGTTTMLADGARKAVEGHTTPEEVMRIAGVAV